MDVALAICGCCVSDVWMLLWRFVDVALAMLVPQEETYSAKEIVCAQETFNLQTESATHHGQTDPNKEVPTIKSWMVAMCIPTSCPPASSSSRQATLSSKSPQPPTTDRAANRGR